MSLVSVCCVRYFCFILFFKLNFNFFFFHLYVDACVPYDFDSTVIYKQQTKRPASANEIWIELKKIHDTERNRMKRM